jgi:hypothetical protein
MARPDLAAVWPAPIDHDACFRAAGFSDFADTGDIWEAEFRKMAGGLVTRLSSLGIPNVTKPIEARKAGFLGLGRRASALPLVEQLMLSTRDDQFPPLIVRFGEPPAAVLRTSGGHPIFWVTLTCARIPEILVEVAKGRPVIETQLAWETLLPVFT